jgi:hypothetical protein
MKVVASIQAKKSSSRGLVHYIAHSKIDDAKEPKGREIFNQYSDDLSVEKANDLLKKELSAKRPVNEELHHLVISFRAEDFERLGSDEKERQKSLKEITRQAMRRLENEIGAERLNWTAGIHRNTDHPHVHIAIQKEYFDKNLEKKTLGRIPTALIPHYEKNETGEKTFTPGCLIESATEKLDEILQEKEKLKHTNKQKSRLSQNRENNSKQICVPKPKIKNERDILARAILAKYYLTKSQENLSSLEDHGDKRRFKIFDEITQTHRKMSLFDLVRRAEKNASRNINKQNPKDAIVKEELKKKLIETELQQNEHAVKRIKTILHNLIVKENRQLRERESEYKTVKPLAEKIRQNYRQENKKIPIPNLTPEDLEMLQSEALEKKDFRVAVYFEKVRKELSTERGTPTRTNEEIARLLAKQKLADLKIKWQEKQLKDFQSQKRAFSVEVNGKKQNLAQIDSLIEKATQDERKVISKVSKVLGKIGLIEPKTTLQQLEDSKALIIEKLVEKNDQMEKSLTDEKSPLKTFDEFYKNDTNPEKETLPAKFSAAELAEVESLACSLKLADVYRENWEQQKQLIESAEGKGQGENNLPKESKENFIAGRAIAREVVCEIEAARAKEEYANFKKHKDFQKFEIIDKKTGEAKFVSLSEVSFDSSGSIFDQTLEYFLENREKRRTRHTLEKQVKEKGTELKENVKSANNLFQVARDIASDFKTKSFFGGTRYHHPPIFTPKELMTIELKIIQTTSKSEAKSLQKILNLTDTSQAKNLPEILREFETKKEHTKSVASVSPDKQKTAIQIDKNEAKSRGKTPKIQENKTEILNQDRGR